MVFELTDAQLGTLKVGDNPDEGAMLLLRLAHHRYPLAKLVVTSVRHVDPKDIDAGVYQP